VQCLNERVQLRCGPTSRVTHATRRSSTVLRGCPTHAGSVSSHTRSRSRKKRTRSHGILKTGFAMAGSALGGSGTQNPRVGNASPGLPSPSRFVASAPSVRDKDTHCGSTRQYLSSRGRRGSCTPRRLVGIGCLHLERRPLRRGVVDPFQRWGSSGTWLTLFEINHDVPLYESVRNSDRSGIRARAKFLENDKPGREKTCAGLL